LASHIRFIAATIDEAFHEDAGDGGNAQPILAYPAIATHAAERRHQTRSRCVAHRYDDGTPATFWSVRGGKTIHAL